MGDSERTKSKFTPMQAIVDYKTYLEFCERQKRGEIHISLVTTTPHGYEVTYTAVAPTIGFKPSEHPTPPETPPEPENAALVPATAKLGHPGEPVATPCPDCGLLLEQGEACWICAGIGRAADLARAKRREYALAKHNERL
jgi:hypothetical protein